MAKLSVQPFAKFPNEYVTIERTRKLSLLEEKLVYMLINAMQKRYEIARKEAVVDYDYIANAIITINEFIKTMQIGNENKKQIRETLKNLNTFGIAIYTNTSDRFMVMFKEFYVDYNKQTIEYKFNDSFVTYFTGVCRDYFKLSIQEVIALNSTYAIRIYQLLKTKLNMDINNFTFTLHELKTILNLEQKYKQYGHFKTKVLEVAKEQINESEASEFCIAYEEIKTSRAVTSIRFHLLKKSKNYYDEKQILPAFKIDLINKICMNIKKEDKTKSSVEYIIAEKILQELKHKKPILPMIRNYLGIIERHLDKKYGIFD